MGAQNGLSINCGFLEEERDPEFWFLDMVPDQNLRMRLKKLANEAKSKDEGQEVQDYDMGVFEAIKHLSITEFKGGNLESLEDFNKRTLAYKEKIRNYAAANVADDETLLIVTHSRWINCFFEAMKWSEEKNLYTWGVHTETCGLFETTV